MIPADDLLRSLIKSPAERALRAALDELAGRRDTAMRVVAYPDDTGHRGTLLDLVVEAHGGAVARAAEFVARFAALLPEERWPAEPEPDDDDPSPVVFVAAEGDDLYGMDISVIAGLRREQVNVILGLLRAWGLEWE